MRFGMLLLMLVARVAHAQTADTLAHDRAPEATLRVNPVYPDSVARAGIEGRVYVRAFVKASGETGHVQVARGVHPSLDSAAVRAVRQWLFRPAERAGMPVDAWITLPVRFRLPTTPLPDVRPMTGPLVFTVVPGSEPSTAIVDSMGCRSIVKPVPRTLEQPEYPVEARTQRQSGYVLSWVSISTGGRVTAIEVTEATSRDFAEATMAALVQWRFTPARCNGTPYEARIQLPMRFRSR